MPCANRLCRSRMGRCLQHTQQYLPAPPDPALPEFAHQLAVAWQGRALRPDAFTLSTSLRVGSRQCKQMPEIPVLFTPTQACHQISVRLASVFALQAGTARRLASLLPRRGKHFPPPRWVAALFIAQQPAMAQKRKDSKYTGGGLTVVGCTLLHLPGPNLLLPKVTQLAGH